MYLLFIGFRISRIQKCNNASLSSSTYLIKSALISNFISHIIFEFNRSSGGFFTFGRRRRWLILKLLSKKRHKKNRYYLNFLGMRLQKFVNRVKSKFSAKHLGIAGRFQNHQSREFSDFNSFGFIDVNKTQIETTVVPNSFWFLRTSRNSNWLWNSTERPLYKFVVLSLSVNKTTLVKSELNWIRWDSNWCIYEASKSEADLTVVTKEANLLRAALAMAAAVLWPL